VVFSLDFREDGSVLEWSIVVGGKGGDSGVVCERVTDYTPMLYVGANGDRSALDTARERLARFPSVVETVLERHRPSFRHDPEPMLRVDVDRLSAIREVASEVEGWGTPGYYPFRCFNVDLSREFSYCLENGIDPTPAPVRDLRTLAIDVPAESIASESLAGLELDGEPVATGTDTDAEADSADPGTALAAIATALAERDPDVLVLSSGAIVPLCYSLAEGCRRGVDFDLGRRPGYQQLAGASTYESYGRVGHSPARYNVPGRVIIDRSSSFLWRETNLAGCLDLVERSRKPLQELGWASIGNVLTAIQIRAARDRDVLVPWNAWRPELFKSARTLREADRGGFTFAPEVGVHEPVHELNFSSLYPNIIRTRNVSPERIRCACHAGRDDVPELGYAICDKPGYLPEVLGPLIDAREELKARIEETTDESKRAALAGRASAIKWILVSCFGYQGFSNAKFGRIECHEAINAFAREILLNAKEVLEANGWRVVHGIVDSLWVTAGEDVDEADRVGLQGLAARITDQVGIPLEYEAEYEWVAFVPQHDSEAGALTKYFGKLVDPEAGDDPYKIRGIECRQHSTPGFVGECQRELIATFDRTRSPEVVCDRLQRALGRLDSGEVDPLNLVIEERVSKRTEAYSRATRTVAALRRAEMLGCPRQPGQRVRYVVVDDDHSSERVCLAHEVEQGIDGYDREFYADQLSRAAESVLAPAGWRRNDIEAYLAERTDASLSAFE
jgi:DNA polymerase I